MTALATAALLAAAWAQGASTDLRRAHGEFECRLGPGWVERDDWRSRMPAYVFTRPEEEEPFPMITVEKFPAGNPLYPKPKDYLEATGTGEGQVRRAGFAFALSRKHPLWERRYAGSSGGFEGGTRSEWRVKEQFVILERPRSFYVLTLRAAPERFDSLRREYLAFLKSFRFLD